MLKHTNIFVCTLVISASTNPIGVPHNNWDPVNFHFMTCILEYLWEVLTTANFKLIFRGKGGFMSTIFSTLKWLPVS
jgi:hypothetical protein